MCAGPHYCCSIKFSLFDIYQVEDFSGEYNGQELDPELFLVETDKEYDAEGSEHPFNHDEWTLKSGLAVIDLLRVAAGIKGHLMR